MSPFEFSLTAASSRRRWLQCSVAAGVSLVWPKFLCGAGPDSRRPPNFGRARTCVVVFLFGGPGQQDLWDLKPDAPTEIRGEFKPAATNVPGLQISDHLPLLTRQADKLTLIRSMTHKDFEHGSASYTALTGHPHPLPGTNTPARPEDFPTYGAVVARQRPTSKPIPSAAVLGPVMHQGNRPPLAGQNAGFLGKPYEPYRIAGDPSQPDFAVTGLALPETLDAGRMSQRVELLQRLEAGGSSVTESPAVQGMTALRQRAFGLLSSSRTQRAFDLGREPAAVRDRYGRHRFGQTMLLVRRLVEAEVPLVTVNWSRLNSDQWDTHKNNYATLKSKLLPPFDQGFAAFLSELSERGLLDETLVMALGEFGRTPKVNKDAGRDHWPDCYSVALAGAGLKAGFVHGASDRQAAYPTDAPVAPWDLSATLYHLMGIDPGGHVPDRLNRPFAISPGRVIEDVLA